MFGSDKKYFPTDTSVFVFGSNLAGIHGGGAAAVAAKDYGAISGIGFGFMPGNKGLGSCYAIPTKDETIKKPLRLTELAYWIDKFNQWAIVEGGRYSEIFVTRIGCGLAGFKERDVAQFFWPLYWPSNVTLPTGW